MNSPFRVSVINDEIGQDFGHVVEIASREFGLEWIELRGMWNKNLLQLDAKEIAEARRLLEKARLRVTDIATDNSRDFSLDWVAVRVSYDAAVKGKGKTEDSRRSAR